MNKTLASLIERAERKGNAVKRVRANQIMGNENCGSTDMVNQWEVEHVQTFANVSEHFESVKVYHYDTLIFFATNMKGIGWVLQDYYGESKSDADALNGLCRYFGIDKGFSYGKSRGFITC